MGYDPRNDVVDVDLARKRGDHSAIGAHAAAEGNRKFDLGLCGLFGGVPRFLHFELGVPLLRRGLCQLDRLDRWAHTDGLVLRFLLLLCEEQVVWQQARPPWRLLSPAPAWRAARTAP